MPKRSNDFQQLVHMIQSALAPTGARVTESAIVGEMREIDVLVESEVGPYLIKIAVEAKDEKRPLDVGTIEELIGKYQPVGGLAVNQVVLVSRNGFTKAATKRAKAANIELHTLNEVQPSDWLKLVPPKQQMTFRMHPRVVGIDLIPQVPNAGGKDPITEGKFVCKCHGNDMGSPKLWAEWLFRTQVLENKEFFLAADEHAKRINGSLKMELPWSMERFVLEFDGLRHEVKEIRVHIHYMFASGEAKWASYSMSNVGPSGKIVDQLDATAGNQRLRLLFPDGPKSDKVILRLDSVPSEQVCIVPDGPKKVEIKTNRPSYCPIHMPPLPKGTPNVGPRKPMNVGRNDPCPCGSGKKFKKCCLDRSRSADGVG